MNINIIFYSLGPILSNIYVCVSVFGRPCCNCNEHISPYSTHRANQLYNLLPGKWSCLVGSVYPAKCKRDKKFDHFPFVQICNLSLQEGIFPDELKIANVFLLIKECDPCVFINYPPVLSFCLSSKLYEYMALRVRIDKKPGKWDSWCVFVFSKALHTVDHEILRWKLSHYDTQVLNGFKLTYPTTNMCWYNGVSSTVN